MPLSEDHHASKKGKSEFSHSTKMPNYSSDLSSFMPEHELVELLWENGQIVMQGQSNRTKKSSAGTEFAFNGRLEDKFAHELPPTVPMLAQEDDAAPWLNYALDDSIQNDFCSELFSELTGVHTPSLSNTNSNLYPSNKSTGYSQATKDSHILKSSPGASDPSRSLNHFGDLNIARSQKPSQQSSGAGLMNFPYFSRPAALVKANLDGIDRLRSRESTVVQSRNDLLKSFNQPKVDSGSHGKTRVDETELVQNSTVVSRISSSPNCQASSFAASMAAERKEAEKGTEAAVASSSVCSGYDAVAASNDPNHKSKKRAREGDESGEESDDLEEELFVVKKPASSSGRVTAGKRSRAAEVHNLSERRRRDRINEKMKALQELIPNCNKVDKASMLDEAIEYLKSLQLQVQMMSMGNGLFMPPMMLPAGMSFQQLNMRAPQVPHFSPLGMGMGVGFGMGMIDLNGSPGLIPVPPLMAGTQFPCPTVAGVAGLGLHGILPSSTIHSLGIAGQRLPVPVPHAPLFNSQPGLSPQNPLKLSGKDPSCSNNQKQQQNANIKEPKGQASKAFVQNSPTLPMDKAVCQLMQKESKELNGRRVETVNPDAINSKSTRTRIACSAKKNCS